MDIEHLMSDNPHGTELVGPFVELDNYKIVIDGYLVPYIRAMLHSGTDDRWMLTLDDRFSLPSVPDEEVKRWLPFVANAMAVAAGYSAHGENCQPTNRHKVKFETLFDAQEQSDAERI